MKKKEYSYESERIIFDLPWISDCDFSFIKNLPCARKKIYLKDEVIMYQGEYNKNIYYIEKGRVKYSVLNSDGKEKTVGIIVEGNIFGEVSAWDDNLGQCSVVSISEEVVVYYISDIKVLLENTKHAKELIKSLVRKNNILMSEVISLNFKKAPQRLAKCILNLSKKYGTENNSGNIKILVSFTHQQMADLLGVSRVTVTNILNNMRKEEIIDYNSNFLVVIDSKRLREIASDDC